MENLKTVSFYWIIIYSISFLVSCSNKDKRGEAYLMSSKESISKLSDKDLYRRNEEYLKLKSTKTYKDMAVDKAIMKEHLDVLTAISESHRTIHYDSSYCTLLFSVSSSRNEILSEDEKNFFLSFMKMAINGGMPEEFVPIHFEYLDSFSSYGTLKCIPNTKLDLYLNKLLSYYNFTATVSILEPTTDNFENIAKATESHLMEWYVEPVDGNVLYPYLHSLKGFNDFCKTYCKDCYFVETGREIDLSNGYIRKPQLTK